MEILSKTLVDLVFTVCEGLVDGSRIIVNFLSLSVKDLLLSMTLSFGDWAPTRWLLEIILNLVESGLPFLNWTVLEFMFSAGIGFTIAFTIIKWLVPIIE